MSGTLLASAPGARAFEAYPRPEQLLLSQRDVNGHGADLDIFYPSRDSAGTPLLMKQADFLRPEVYAFYRSQGFSDNFLVWAPIRPVPAASLSPWSYCSQPHGARTICTANVLWGSEGPGDWISGNATVKSVTADPGSTGTYISAVCGNFSKNTSDDQAPPTIAGVKFEDLNANGNRDAGEPGINNWTIRLRRPDGHVVTTTTSADGSYAFVLNAGAGFTAGAYDIEEVMQPGWHNSTATSHVVTVEGAKGATHHRVDFGNYRNGSIAGHKFVDELADGITADDTPKADWKISLGGAKADVTTTGTDGAYRFDELRPGTYKVTEEQKTGWHQSAPGDPLDDTPRHFTVTIQSGQKVNGRDFANWQPVAIDGHKFEDSFADGITNDDTPIGGWGMDLAGTTSAGPVDDATSTADGTGAYRFAELRPGTYTVTEEQRDGWHQSAPGDPLDDAPRGRTVELTSGETAADQDFANWRPVGITGRKFDDHGADGSGDGDEGISDWGVTIDGTTKVGPTVHHELTTGADGSYELGGLRPGDYTVTEEQRAHWRQSAPASGTFTRTLASGATAGPLEFGNVCLGKVDTTITNRRTGAGYQLASRLEEISPPPGILDNEPALPWEAAGGDYEDLLPGRYRLTLFLPGTLRTIDPETQWVDGKLAIVKDIDITECGTTNVMTTVDTPDAPGFVTGGVEFPLGESRGTAGFNFKGGQFPNGPSGTLEWQDHDLGLNLHTKVITSVLVYAQQTKAVIWGFLDYGAQTGKVFRLDLSDLGEPGVADAWHLEVYDTDYDVEAVPDIRGGNVQIHTGGPGTR